MARSRDGCDRLLGDLAQTLLPPHDELWALRVCDGLPDLQACTMSPLVVDAQQETDRLANAGKGALMSVAWFVDGGYSLKAWNSVSRGARMDFGLLRSQIEDDAGEKIGDAYYFDCDSDPPNVAQSAFHSFLQSTPPRGAGMRVKLYWLQTKHHEWPRSMGGGPIVHPESGEQYVTKIQKGVDVGLAFHLMRSYSMVGWDKLYLIAGDGDYHEVIQHLVENEGVDVKVIGTSETVSREIAPYVKVVEFADIRDRIARPAPTSR